MRFDSYSTSSRFVPPCIRWGARQSWGTACLEILDSAVLRKGGDEFEEGTAIGYCDGDTDVRVRSVADDVRRCSCGVAGCITED